MKEQESRLIAHGDQWQVTCCEPRCGRIIGFKLRPGWKISQIIGQQGWRRVDNLRYACPEHGQEREVGNG